MHKGAYLEEWGDFTCEEGAYLGVRVNCADEKGAYLPHRVTTPVADAACLEEGAIFARENVAYPQVREIVRGEIGASLGAR